MAADIRRTAPAGAVPAGMAHGAAIEAETHRRMSWGAIIAGTLVAMATMIFLGLLGAGIGLWAVEPGGETDTVAGMTTGATIYFVIVQLIALFVGGYVAARASATWDKQNAVLHGVVVWALATVLGAFMAMSAASALFFTTVSAVKNSASVVADATQAVVPNELPSFNLPDVQMSDLPPRIQRALRRQGITAENFKAEAREAFRNVISQEEQAAAREVATDTALDIIRTPSDAMADIDAAIDQLVGDGGVISEQDRNELLAVMERRFGITAEEAETMLTRWQERAEAALNRAQTELEEARREAIAYADSATDALAGAAFAAFIASLLGLVVAGYGALTGRREHELET